VSSASISAVTGDGQVKQKLPSIPEFLPDVINCNAEDDPLITGFADSEKTALIAFIAPRVPVRVSPVQTARASIGLLDEFGVEALVNKLAAAKVKRAYLLVNSPGGAMDSSYKIALAVRQALDHITTFVPHVAASGGTLLALTGNEIYMGPMSHITPLDTQVYFDGAFVSATSSYRFFQRALEWFEKITPDEAPYPQRALTDKLDPYIMEEWNGVIETMTDYVREILTLSGYGDKATTIAQRLVTRYPIHQYVINEQKAKGLGLNIKDAADNNNAWLVMRYWLSKYVIQQEMTHCIRFVIPNGGSQNGRAKPKTTRNRKTSTRR
jgi:Serine dehydrogenase proteinase